MMAQCTAHAQLKSVYGVSRVTCHRTPGPPIFMSKVRGPGVEANRREKKMNKVEEEGKKGGGGGGE